MIAPWITGDDYVAGELKWRARMEAELRRPDGWLAVDGLYWLKEGASSFGCDPKCEVVLPDGSAPARAGTFTRRGTRVDVKLEPGVTGSLDGRALTNERTLSATIGAPKKLRLGALTMTVIERGGRVGVRLWNEASKARRTFEGMKWFDFDPSFRVEATYTTYNPPHRMSITNVIGDTAPVTVPGYVEFTLHGQPCRLEAQLGGEGLFFNFKDATSGESTYPAGRFLDAPAPKDGKVVIDFNRAVNPPCAFTRFATCPLAPRQNWLNVAIPAGEKTHHPAE